MIRYFTKSTRIRILSTFISVMFTNMNVEYFCRNTLYKFHGPKPDPCINLHIVYD